MNRRLLAFLLCAVPGLLLLVLGLVVPAHLRGVDVAVLRKAGQESPALLEQGLTLVRQSKLGTAQLLLEAARQEGIPDGWGLGRALTNAAAQHPAWLVWGGGDSRLERLFASDARLPKRGVEPIAEFLVRQQNRTVALEVLKQSPLPAVQELLQCRNLTNTVVFPPSHSSAGQALDSAVAICGLLLEGGHMSGGLSDAVFTLAAASNTGADPQRLEQVLLDLMSLGQRMNWGQLVGFVGPIRDAETLRLLTIQVRQNEARLPVIYAAVQLSGKPDQVAAYLVEFSRSGLGDLGTSLRYGVGGVGELLRRHQRLERGGVSARLAALPALGSVGAWAAGLCWRSPLGGLMLKWFLYLAAGFLLAVGLHFARPAATELERPLQVRGFHVAREVLFALGFLLVVLLLSEPFLAQESQRVEFPLRLRLPMVGSAVPAGSPGVTRSIMNQLSLLTLLLFFVLQSLLYTACLVKLAEIRRQLLAPRIKLRLLENEEHLFDAGLYLGFAGTIISLILVSLGVIQPSLMAAYSSTSFGIVFVSVFKIFNLRPMRRQLLLESESHPIEASGPGAKARVATQP